MEDYEGRSANTSFLGQQSPNIYHHYQDNSPMNSRGQGEEINSNHLLMSPTALPFTEDEHQIYRVDKVSSSDRHGRHSKESNVPNPSMSTATFSTAVNPHNQYFGENYYESPSMAMIDPINSSHCYTTHHNQHVSSHDSSAYNDVGERNTFQHNIYDATNHESYNSVHSIHVSSIPSSTDISSIAEESLSSSAVAFYHFNNTLIDFTNPSDIFQFDRVHSSSNDAEETNHSSICSYPQQHQPSPSSNQGKIISSNW